LPADLNPALLPPPPPPEYIVIEPVDSNVYYVPVYDPAVVYGPWAWSAYMPFFGIRLARYSVPQLSGSVLGT
jgi:Protein of unknown function (DUF3300)